jgi:aquaporin Z
MNRYLTEFVGTFFLVFTIGCSVVNGTPMAPLAIGAALMVMVYMGGHISGAHYNPAVSLGLVMRGALPAGDYGAYVASQLLGAVAAAFAAYLATGQTFVPAPGPGASTFSALLVEILFTTALVLVVMNVATAPATAGNSFYGLAIGFTVAAGAFAVGPISGGAFNPAVGLGPALVHAIVSRGPIGHVWLYIVGPCIGGALAAAIFKMQGAAAITKPK